MKPYEKLDAWMLAHALALDTFRVTAGFPKSELYGVTSQTRRAALSVPTNIVEGSAKRGPREFRRFLDMAIGSLAELSYLLRFARDLGILSPEDWKHLNADRERVGIVTWRLYASIRDRRSRTTQ
jgi:four helix bundle protein